MEFAARFTSAKCAWIVLCRHWFFQSDLAGRYADHSFEVYGQSPMAFFGVMPRRCRNPVILIFSSAAPRLGSRDSSARGTASANRF